MSMSESSGSSSSNPQLTPQQLISLYNTSLPSALGITASQAPAVTQTLAQAAAGANPTYTQSGLDQLNNLAGGYQQAGANLANQQAQSQANLLAGSGANAASAANNLVNQYDPTVSSTNTQANNLVNSINLNGLSGGEQAATERSLNQSNYATGNLGLDNATNAVSNAMNFGNALQAKRTALGNAINTADTTTTTNNAVFNPVTTATNAGNTSSNFGLGTFNPTQANSTTGTATTFGSNFANNLTGIGSSQKSGSSNQSVGGGCFLTTACCKYKELPDDCEELTVLRRFRDECVPVSMVKEYYRIAPKIVRKINGNRLILEDIYNNISYCVKQIKNCRRDLAINSYINMVSKLKDIYGII